MKYEFHLDKVEIEATNADEAWERFVELLDYPSFLEDRTVVQTVGPKTFTVGFTPYVGLRFDGETLVDVYIDTMDVFSNVVDDETNDILSESVIPRHLNTEAVNIAIEYVLGEIDKFVESMGETRRKEAGR